jgi:serine/threonine protein kinase
MSSTVQASEEVLPGYVLTERIGSGGYAEVWRARAPGGIDKAVKLVHGYYDEELAVQEMKSLERIKDVRHTFLLSLERFDVVDGRLAIITELADMSLEQRAQQCRADGLPGIPREELVRYLTDAAEALDYLAIRHGLQHLDIKPANLLILGDHIKVADFGLVKELTAHTQNSLVAGMTPSYSSPEMFDDSPSAHSDQYSLAIVYQEMLVGSLPFPGRTAAQLAKQHTLAQPQLAALPFHDRPIIARALAKLPAERFPSCREFLRALRNLSDVTAADRDPPVRTTKSSSPNEVGVPACALEDTKSAANGTTIPVSEALSASATESGGTRSLSSSRSAVAECLVEEIIDVSSPENDPRLNVPQPTLVVAIGGVGIRVLSRLRQSVVDHAGSALESLPLECLAVDTDRSELKEACSGRWSSPLSAEDVLHLPLRLPQEYLENSCGQMAWMSRRWLYNIPRSLETRGYRPLGRLALVDHSQRALAQLDQKLAMLQTRQLKLNDPVRCQPVRVIVVTGMGGGTGGGMAIDLANAARSLAPSHGIEIELHAVLVCTCLGGANSQPLAAANTYSLLTELDHATRSGNRGALSQQGSHPFEWSGPPFDSVYCVPARSRESCSSSQDALVTIGEGLAFELTSTCRGVLRTWRQNRTPKECGNSHPLLIRSFGWSSLATFRKARANRLAAQLGTAVRRYWLEEVQESDWRSLPQLPEFETVRPLTTAPLNSTPTVAELQRTAASPPNSEELRSLFDAYQSTRFALGLVNQLCCSVGRQDPPGAARPSRLRLRSITEGAKQAISSIGKCDESTHDVAVDQLTNSASFHHLVAATSDRILVRVIDEVLASRGDNSCAAEIVERLIAEECNSQVSAHSPNIFNAIIDALQLQEEDIRQALAETGPQLLQCGFDRRTLIVVNSDSQSAMASTLKSIRPTSLVVSADNAEETILCEASGIMPRSLAVGMERIFPDIADAAGRLYTRTDIDWQAPQ